MAEVRGIGTVEYGKIVYGGNTVPLDYAPRPAVVTEYALLVQSDHPLYYLRMDELAGGLLVDFSESQNHAYYLGNLDVNKAPLTTGGTSCLFYSGGYAFSPLPPPLRGGVDAPAFTIELWTKPVGVPTTSRLLVGRNDLGVWMTPTGYEFRITNTQGVTYTAQYTVSTWDDNYHVVAAFGDNQIYLHVNGYSAENVFFFGVVPEGTSPIYVGGEGGAGPEIYLDEVAVYRGMLPNTSIFTHYNTGQRKPPYLDLVAADGGLYFTLEDSYADVALRYEERTREELTSGTLTNLSIVNSRLVLTDPALPGVRVSPMIDLGELGIVDSSRVDWEATTTDITFEISLDLGVTWAALTNHSPVPGIGTAADMTDKIAMFRMTIPAGTTYRAVNRFGLSVYSSRTTKSVNSNYDAVTAGVVDLSEKPYDFMNSRKTIGAEFKGGNVVIGPFPTEAPIAMIDMFVRRETPVTASNNFVFDIRTAAETTRLGYLLFDTDYPGSLLVGAGVLDLYVDGVLRNDATIEHFPINEWVHVAASLNVPTLNPITFGARYNATGPLGGSIAHVGLYPRVLTAAEVNEHATRGWSKSYAAVGDFRTATIQDSTPRIYSYTWQTLVAAV